MTIYKTTASVLACILMLSIIPALSECSTCSGVAGCRTSQFSTNCRYNCSCHRNSSGSCLSSSLPNPAPTLRPIATAEPDFSTETATANSKSTLASEIVRQVNAERRKHGLGELSVDSGLSQAAYIRALEIINKFSHTRPDGTSWRTVSSLAKGENIARGYNTADKVMAAWLTSEGHRANILRSGYTIIGVSAIEYNGVLYWVQLFGTK